MAILRCDCGAEYTAGAEYCPNCGRPLTEEALAKERALNAFPREPEDAPKALPPVSFGNVDALRACYWPGALAALLVSLPLFGVLCWVWYPAAGFSAVASYRKRSGANLTVAEGAKLGWIAGVITFTLSLVLGALASLVGEGFGPALEQLRKQFAEQGEAEMAEVVAKLAADPATLATVILIGLALTFLFVTSMTTLGGSLGARILYDKNADAPPSVR
ncbi:MAG: hypothetical protein GC160_12685 [Acidobacteria bacterium]|nr:hypothetical protein [Acidobacteriota bacterium]